MILRFVCVVLFSLGAGFAAAAPEQRFDVATICCGCTSSNQNFCVQHFNALNFRTPNGHYFAMGFDTYRSEMVAKGNILAVYHNDLNTSYTFKTPGQKATEIHDYVTDRFMTNGPRPEWVILNEISAGLWPGNAVYRSWVVDVLTSLSTTYNYKVILASPFSNPGANNADWQRVAARAYVGVENYLSGEEVMAQGFSVAWCRAQYQSSKTSYKNRGVPEDRIFLFEHFANTVAGTGWGRAGLSADNWDQVISVRNQAIQEANFAGFCSYAWSHNSLNAPETDVIRFMNTYAKDILPTPYPASVDFWTMY